VELKVAANVKVITPTDPVANTIFQFLYELHFELVFTYRENFERLSGYRYLRARLSVSSSPRWRAELLQHGLLILPCYNLDAWSPAYSESRLREDAGYF
jgi:hypothetical protein